MRQNQIVKDTLTIDVASAKLLNDRGELTCKARVARIGIMSYMDHAGKEVKRYRSEAEVFSRESMDSLKLIPITFQHPEGLVNVKNNEEHQVGTTGETPVRDGDWIVVTIRVTDEQVVQYILDKKERGEDVKVSCGYLVSIDDKPGEFRGEAYDQTHSNIRYNHLSIVSHARAGEKARLQLDKKEKEMEMINIVLDSIRKGQETVLDAITISIPQNVESTLRKLHVAVRDGVEKLVGFEADASKQKASFDELQGKFDKLEADHKETKEELDQLSDPASEKAMDMLSAYSEVVNVAKAHDVKVKDADGKTLSISKLKSAICSKVNDGADFKDKSVDYVDGFYGSIAKDVDGKIEKDQLEELDGFVAEGKVEEEKDGKSSRQTYVESANDQSVIDPETGLARK